MKKFTVVLTAAALAASLFTAIGPSEAQSTNSAESLASLVAKGYDPTLASNAIASTTDAAAMLAGINSVRKINGLPQLVLDQSLAAAAAYQQTAEVKYTYSASSGRIDNGTVGVSAAQMATDFGSVATNVQEASYGNALNLADTDNWVALMNDWQAGDSIFASIFNSASVNVAGIDLVDTGLTENGAHIYKWVLLVGYNPNAVTATGPTGPTLNLTGLNQSLANSALAATPTATEQAFLATINSFRTSAGHQPLSMASGSSPLYAAAYYDVRDGSSDNGATLASDFGGQYTEYGSSSFTNNSYYGYLLGYYGNWTTMTQFWASLAPTFGNIVGSTDYKQCGLSIYDTGTQGVSPMDGNTYEIYNWVIVAGN